MNICLFIALLSVPFLSVPDLTYGAGYAKELIFCVLSAIGLTLVLVRTRQWTLRIYDVVAVLFSGCSGLNPFKLLAQRIFLRKKSPKNLETRLLFAYFMTVTSQPEQVKLQEALAAIVSTLPLF